MAEVQATLENPDPGGCLVVKLDEMSAQRQVLLLDGKTIEAGEEVAVSRRGRVIARLVPEPVKSPGRVDWRQSAAHRMDKSTLPRLSAADAATLLAESQGGR